MAILTKNFWASASQLKEKWHRHFSPEEVVAEAQVREAVEQEAARVAARQSKGGAA